MHSELRTIFSFKRYFPAILLLIVFLIITISLYLIVKKKRKKFQETIFENRSALAKEAIHQRIHNYILILRGTRALFSSSDTVTSPEWNNYITSLQMDKHYPGSRGIGYSLIVDDDNESSILQRAQKEIIEDFEIWPKTTNKLKAPITYWSPFVTDSKKVFGFDIMSESKRRKAIEYCIKENIPTFTSKVVLITEPDSLIQPGFVIYIPVFKNNSSIADESDRLKNIRGIIFSPFRINDFINAILKKDFIDLEIEIYDNSIKRENLIFDNNTKNNLVKRNHQLRIEKKIEFNGNKWLLIFESKQKYISPADREFPIIILATGTLISILIFIIAWAILHNKHKSDVTKKIIQDKNLELTKINNELDNFVYTASHDLKSPINNLEGLMRMLDEEVTKYNNTNLPSLVKMMDESIDKLKNTIIELTDIGRIQKETVEKYEEIDVKELLDEVLFNYKKTIKDSEAHIDFDLEIDSIKFSKKNLRSMFDNLISNALKYCSQDRNPEILIRTYKKDQLIHFSIKDNGLGIPEDQLENIFGMFKRAHSHVPGSGVGLYLIKRIMDNSEGKIKLTSKVDEGSEFILVFKHVK